MSITEWFKNKNNAGTVSGVGFSTLHATAFGRSDSSLIQGLGLGSLALTLGVSIVKKQANLNTALSKKLEPILSKMQAPEYSSMGFPLFLNGVVLGTIALASFAKGDYTSGSIALTYAMANTDKGARLSQGNNATWTVETIFSEAFKKAAKLPMGDNLQIAFKQTAENPSRFIKHSLYLPEFWGSAGAFAFAMSHSGLLAIPGIALASVGVVHAAINNGDNQFRAQIKAAEGKESRIGNLIERISSVSDRLQTEEIETNNQAMSRRFMKYASFTYSTIALAGGNVLPAVGHAAGGVGNWVLERADKARQREALNLTQIAPA